MTVGQCITMVDALKPNKFTKADKLKWLSDIDGMIVRLELPELKEMVSLLRYASNNINQIARRINESGRVYDTDLEQVIQNQEQLWDMVNGILVKLAGIK